MSDETKPARREPVLQPMRVVQVPETPVVAVSTSPGLTDAKGKKLVVSKKEYEAKKSAKNLPKQSPYHKPLVPAAEVYITNQTLIDDLDRNAKLGRNEEEQAPQYDMDWLKQSGGRLVTIAWLQTSVSVSGFVSSESTFSAQKIRGLTMSWVTDGLLCKIENTNGKKLLLIPSANVKCMSVDG